MSYKSAVTKKLRRLWGNSYDNQLRRASWLPLRLNDNQQWLSEPVDGHPIGYDYDFLVACAEIAGPPPTPGQIHNLIPVDPEYILTQLVIRLAHKPEALSVIARAAKQRLAPEQAQAA